MVLFFVLLEGAMAKLRVPAAETRVSLSDVEVKPPTFKEMLVAFVVD